MSNHSVFCIEVLLPKATSLAFQKSLLGRGLPFLVIPHLSSNSHSSVFCQTVCTAQQFSRCLNEAELQVLS